MKKPAPKRDGHKQPLIADAIYYVEDSRQIIGNCMLFWCAEAKGYTCNLAEAGKYTGTEVMGMRDTDIPWPVEFIEAHTVVHVRRDALRRNAKDA